MKAKNIVKKVLTEDYRQDLEDLARDIVMEYKDDDWDSMDPTMNAAEAFLDEVVKMELSEILLREHFQDQAGHLSPEDLQWLTNDYLPQAVRQHLGLICLKRAGKSYPGVDEV